MVPLPWRFSIQSRKYAVVAYPASHLSPPETFQCGGAYPAFNLTKSVTATINLIPIWRSEHGPTCDTFYESPWAGTLGVVLVTVNDFVDEYAHDFVSCPRNGRADIVERKMNLLVCVRSSRVRDAIKGSEDERDFLDACAKGSRSP